MNETRMVLTLAVVCLVGCPSPYSGKAEVPARELAGDVGGYVEVSASLQPGTALHSGAPSQVALREARCLDESVCEVALQGGKALVGGKKEGETEVRLAFVQPNGGETTVQTVKVRFRTRPTRGFALGQPGAEVAHVAHVIERPSTAGPSTFRCVLGRADTLRTEDRDGGWADVFRCTAGRELSPGHWYLPSGDRPSTDPSTPSLVLCRHRLSRSGEVAAIATYRDEPGAGLTPISYEGEPHEICRPKP